MGDIFFKRFTDAPGDLDILLSRARNGDGDAREKLIEGCRRFIEKKVARQTYNSLDLKSRDEYSIGLIAFNEAIDKFDPGHNRAFLSFAGDVIKMRIIDYYRKNKAEANCLPLSAFECSEEISYGRPAAGALDPVGERVERECDLASFLDSLKEFKISLDDLVKNTPKHRDSRLLSIKVARIIAGDPELMGDLYKKKTIPLRKVLDKIKINPKTVERHRKYIITICLVLTGNMETLKGYIEQTEKGGGDDGL
ncbi:RNA polymerase sigma-I factor [Pelotomaculum terephthalicicum JT]|uniref:RNA polymerase sigma-I factor n=1 Tax=Pelotomaculum TaxID=191373 RepID=UPI0009D43B53|nr:MULTISPECIES: RNA polymerase sigma-I factor [Pelotomaculum]MCG9969027.1 RNA polymerase sigma-I factor [Pelotomaculum terephthalicicum JT]OPX91369.1 MAG: RNA polymerase sigma factor SigI [Pelotomaculum sp. PtaB.Bin117]OPY60596.1 MAG: RNA polymerase sigma factor SigI [Pelotomaculum sp. PtaU1.Bin065]